MPVASDQGVTRAPAGVQVGQAQAFHARIGAHFAVVAGLAAVLGGCSDGPTLASINPVDWWHGLEGGPIAQTRPPPPNADAPYPNLGSVPAKPPPPDKAVQAKIAGALVADRANATYDASIAPIPVLPPAAVRPLPQSAATGDADQANASLAAANAPAQPPPKPQAAATSPAPQKAPVGPVTASALPPPAAPAPAPPPGAAEMPAIPDAPPPVPQIAGTSVPLVTAPPPPPATPPAPPPPAPVAGAPVAIPFPAGSAILPPVALAPIKQLAAQRGNGVISVTGFGDADAASDPPAQTSALPLALDRARAVAAGLLADGVPAAFIRIAAEPHGSGAAATVIR